MLHHPQAAPEKRIYLEQGEEVWCVCPDRLNKDSVVYSFGVGCDISLDLGIINEFGCEVHAFDPTPISIDWMRRQNTPPQFHFYEYGVASYDGTAHFVLPTSHGISYSMLEVERYRKTCEGLVFRLPTILGKLGHTKIDLLKLDVEGAEYEILPDLAVCPIDQLLVEFHHRMLPGNPTEKTNEAIKFILESGFRIFNVSPRGFDYTFIRD